MATYSRYDIEQDELVANWLEGTSDKIGTTANYSLALLKYSIFTNRTPAQFIKDQQAFQQQDPITRDAKNGAKYRLERFRKWLNEPHPDVILRWERGTGKVGKTKLAQKSLDKHARRTIRRTIAACRSFYAFYGLSIPRLRRSRSLTGFKEGTNKHEIARALELANPRERALILVGASTGRSTVDLLKLRVGHIDTKRFPGWGYIYDPEQEREKTGIQMVSWLTPEALDAIDVYLRKDRGIDPDKNEYAWLFTESYNNHERPLKSSAVRQTLRRLAEKTFPELLDKTGQLKRNPISLRALRSWFGTQLDRIPRAHKKILLSHALPYDGAYSQPQPSELHESMKQLYNDGFICIRETISDTKFHEIETRIREEMQQRIQDLEKELVAKTTLLRGAEQGLTLDEERQREKLATTLIPVIEAMLAGDKEQAEQVLKSYKRMLVSIRDGREEVGK